MSEPTPRKRPDGWWYPWIFVGMFAIVVVVNGVMTWFATSTFAGLETQRPFEQGVKYNTTLAAAEAQERLGWAVTANLSPLTSKAEQRTAEVSALFKDRDGNPLQDLEVKAWLLRPATKGQDQEVVLEHVGSGRYGATVTLPAPGQWDLQLIARRADQTYQLGRRVTLP